MSEKDIISIKDKYSEIINKSSGKVIKIEEWGLLNLADKIKKIKKVFIFIINLKEKIILWMKLKKKLKTMEQ